MSSIPARNVRCAQVAKRIRKGDGSKDCISFRTKWKQAKDKSNGKRQCFKIEMPQ